MFRQKIKSSNHQFRREVEAMSADVAEMVEMIPVTRAHGLEQVEIDRIENTLIHVQSKGLRSDIIHAYFGAFTNVTFRILQLVCLMFNCIMVYQGRITIGDILLYQAYFTTITGAVQNILSIYPIFSRGFEAINSIGEIMSAGDLEEYNGTKKLKLSGSFEFKNVSFRYRKGGEHVLDNFNLKVSPGECIALVGESGAGKSTVLNLIIGFNKPETGDIFIDGVRMSEIDIHSYRNSLAVVPQNTILFSGTIRENITYGLNEYSEEDLQMVIKLANLQSVIEDLPEGLDTKLGEHGGKLSGGQRQRIAIARAMIRNPQVIILDEATSALDNVSEYKVQQAMESLMKNKTTFIVAHRLSTIRNADRIVVMKKGQCVESGTYDELMEKNGEFVKLIRLQYR